MDMPDKLRMTGSPDINRDTLAAMAAIKEIRSLDLRSVTVAEIVELLIPVFRGYAVIAPRFKPGIKLFRSRPCGKPTNIRELSYPPADKVGIGRANISGNPVLYCSTSREAPFFESHPSIGSTVGIVHWITSAPLFVNHVGYLPGTFNTLGSNRQNAGWGPQDADIPEGDDNKYVADFLAQEFTREVPADSEHLYKLTVAISEKLFSDDIFDGLLYPTVAMRANADNFALKTRYADNHLEFQKAEFVRIDGIQGFEYDITVLDTATEVRGDGTILWKGRRDHWVIRNQGEGLTFTSENGHWVARDKDGTVIDPE